MLTHEIRQPLAAIVANVHAALRWLSNERPNFEEDHAALKAIVSAGHRAGENSQKPPFDHQEGKPSRSIMSFKMSSGSRPNHIYFFRLNYSTLILITCSLPGKAVVVVQLVLALGVHPKFATYREEPSGPSVTPRGKL